MLISTLFAYSSPVASDVVFRNDEVSLLHAAAFYDSLEILDFCIRTGVSPNLESRCGNTPLHYAICNRSREAAFYLDKLGVNVNKKPNKGVV